MIRRIALGPKCADTPPHNCSRVTGDRLWDVLEMWEIDLEEGCIKKTNFLLLEEEEKEMQGEKVDDCRPSLRHGILCLSGRNR
jgi:hypothetical protein